MNAPMDTPMEKPQSICDSAPAVRAYLARLSGRGPTVQEQALRRAASLLWPSGPEGGTGGATPAFERPWRALGPLETASLRSTLAATYAPATARRMLSAVKGVLRECWRLGLISHEAYARAVDLAPVRGERPPAGRSLDPAELRRLLDEAAGGTARERALVAVLALGGLRRAEAAALTRADVRAEDGGVTLRVEGKGRKRRKVFLRGRAAVVALAWRDARQGDPLFGLAPSGVGPLLSTIADRVGVARFTPHDLRRTYATLALARGADVFTVQKSMGHSNPATTLRYDRRNEDDRKRLADKLAREV